jgi:uncharacterized protein
VERYGSDYGRRISRGDVLIDPKLLDLLACPLCAERPPLALRGAFLVCTKCGRGYAVRDGIPCLLPEEAVEPEDLKDQLDGE